MEERWKYKSASTLRRPSAIDKRNDTKPLGGRWIAGQRGITAAELRRHQAGRRKLLASARVQLEPRRGRLCVRGPGVLAPATKICEGADAI